MQALHVELDQKQTQTVNVAQLIVLIRNPFPDDVE